MDFAFVGPSTLRKFNLPKQKLTNAAIPEKKGGKPKPKNGHKCVPKNLASPKLQNLYFMSSLMIHQTRKPSCR